MIYLGIDNGLDGALCVVDGEHVLFHDTPTVTGKSKREYLAVEMAELLRPYAGRAWCGIEAVSGRPGQGVASARSIGLGHGLWLGMLAAFQISHEVVAPHVWKRRFGLIGQDKDASRARAQALYPLAVSELQRKKDADRAEALLLADWIRSRRAGA